MHRRSPLVARSSPTPLRLAIVVAAAACAAATLLGSGREAEAQPDPTMLDLFPARLAAGVALGVALEGDALTLTGEAPSSPAYGGHPRFGIAESAPLPLAGPSVVAALAVDVEAPPGAAAIVELRGRVAGRWSEWRGAGDFDALEGADALQVRATLLASPGGESPRLRSVRCVAAPLGYRLFAAAQAPSAPRVILWATREGLVGRTTANGHVIAERDKFVALPSRRALNRLDGADYQVQISYRGRTAVAPVWDTGPWNIKDDYWNDGRELFADLPRWTSQAEAAFFLGYMSGRDGFGRFITIPTSIDLADGTFWDDLGMTRNDWVEVTFLWLDAPSPPPRATVGVTPKVPPAPPTPIPARGPLGARAASYNAPTPSNRAYLPLLMYQPDGWITPWTVQNASGSPISGAAELYDAGGTRVGAISFELPAWGSATYSPADVPGVGPGFVGGGVLSANGPIAAVVNEDRAGWDRLAYEGMTGGDATVSAPLLFKEFNGWSTGIQVQNLGGGPATVELAYSGPGGPWFEAAVLPPRASRTFYQPAQPSLPVGLVGSATVRSTNGQPLAVIVNEVRTDGAAMAYPGLIGGASNLSAPLLFKRANGWDTGLQLFNLGGAPVSATIAYRGMPQPIMEGMTVPAGGSITLYQPAHPQLPDGYVGWAGVTAATGARLVGVVNEVKAGAQSAMNYAVGQPSGAGVAVPLVMKDSAGWDTGIQLQNAGPTSTGFVASFFDEGGALVYWVEGTLRGGNETRTFYAPGMAELPLGFRGSALFQSTPGGLLAAIVNETSR